MSPVKTLHFSTDALPEPERLEFVREVFGRALCKLDMEPLPEHPLRFEGVLRALPGLAFLSCDVSAMRTSRAGELLADSNDDIGLYLMQAGQGRISQFGREVVVAAGDAAFNTGADKGAADIFPRSQHVTLGLPRNAIAPLVGALEDALVRPIPRNALALRLLSAYVPALEDEETLASPDVQNVVIAHIYDLVALLIGATRDAAATAEKRGVRAARLRAIKADIMRFLTSSELSPALIAGRHKISESYIRKLFGDEGTSFTDFVLQARLARVHRMLRDPRLFGSKIVTLAQDAGFSDLSYFNRLFRRVYGTTPSDVRAAAMTGSAPPPRSGPTHV